MDSLVGLEYLPNVHFGQITLQFMVDKYELEAELILYDYYDNPVWTNDEEFLKYFRVRVGYCKFKDRIQEINSGQFIIGQYNEEIDYLADGLFSFRSIKYDRFVFMDSGVNSFYGPGGYVSVDGKKYNKYRCIFKATLLGTNTDVSLYAFTSIDAKQLAKDKNLDFRFSITPNPRYAGIIRSEKILEDGLTPESSFIYKSYSGPPSAGDPGGKWFGPVHRHAMGLMEGSQHKPFPHKLIRKKLFKRAG